MNPGIFSPCLDRRRAGILLHPTSLPGPAGNGDLGPDAYRFVNFLAEAGLTVWQTLPLVPTQGSASPYQGASVHAGNPLLISLELLVRESWLSSEQCAALQSAADDGDDQQRAVEHRRRCLVDAWQGFQQHASDEHRKALQAFIEAEQHWLEDYALFQAIHDSSPTLQWTDWPQALRQREPEALRQAHDEFTGAVAQIRFEQFVFFWQWQALKSYANERGIRLFGDMPIFVAGDSADVWSAQDLFLLDDGGHATVVAGVPPDYFSEDGQHWGNPHYDWPRMRETDFKWWVQRLNTLLNMFDLVRVDHFRGFEAYWEIDAGEETAKNGRWVKAPGRQLFETLQHAFRSLPLVAEDLGTITREVDELRDRFGFPGMRILQFAFGGGNDNPYLPHNHIINSVVYTGTHDNETTVGWYQQLTEQQQGQVNEYLGKPCEEMPWPLIRAALASVSRYAILPMQDVLALGAEHRMNTPGTIEGNWQWRFDWEQVGNDVTGRLRHLVGLYGRD